ncbi:hypothetical protein QBC32DRAFT_147473 [Pseudoneurospora amorphoporcata]|uniref:Uncharacterized protein n=1 Tax=Pseudoneurospora amorphoporcata TaxID=241081 RepID=A0AAN6P3S7_9PEZI|nr:hypothetical protein QBC32DRAFT_147473 [Pseudoneurospora amorphoporcata]
MSLRLRPGAGGLGPRRGKVGLRDLKTFFSFFPFFFFFFSFLLSLPSWAASRMRNVCVTWQKWKAHLFSSPWRSQVGLATDGSGSPMELLRDLREPLTANFLLVRSSKSTV